MFRAKQKNEKKNYYYLNSKFINVDFKFKCLYLNIKIV